MYLSERNGARFARTIARAAKRGITSRTIRPLSLPRHPFLTRLFQDASLPRFLPARIQVALTSRCPSRWQSTNHNRVISQLGVEPHVPITHVSSASASPTCSAPRNRSSLWCSPSPLNKSPSTKHAMRPLPPAACAAAKHTAASATIGISTQFLPIKPCGSAKAQHPNGEPGQRKLDQRSDRDLFDEHLVDVLDNSDPFRH